MHNNFPSPSRHHHSAHCVFLGNIFCMIFQSSKAHISSITNKKKILISQMLMNVWDQLLIARHRLTFGNQSFKKFDECISSVQLLTNIDPYAHWEFTSHSFMTVKSCHQGRLTEAGHSGGENFIETCCF